MTKTNTASPVWGTASGDKLLWNSEFQINRQRYRRLMAFSKRASIFLGTQFPNTVPLLFVLGHPKSGTTWLCQLLADYFRIPFPQYSILPLGCPAVLHSFETPSKKYRRSVYVMRDGRDVMVSSYFHMRGRVLSGASTTYQQRMFEGLDLQAEPRYNMEQFMSRFIVRPGGGWTKIANWGDHVGAYLAMEGAGLSCIRYEALLTDGEQALSRLISDLTRAKADVGRVQDSLQRYSFQSQSGRSPGDENRGSFLRKGQSGDWVNHFSRKAAEFFDHHFGNILIKVGYATDHDWINEVD